MRAYLVSLNRLQSTGFTTILPGHGPPIADGKRAVSEYIQHRMQRESQIAERLRSGREYSASQLVSEMYRDRILSHELRMAATETVYNHLRFLSEKGQARCVEAVNMSARWVAA